MKAPAAALLLFFATGAAAQSSSFSVAAQAKLDHDFPSSTLSFLLLDSSGRVMAQRWPEGLDTPVPFGSLVKPFLAAAWAEQHAEGFPAVRCEGTKSHCWYPPGHGRLELRDAIAYSCNAYFLHLAENLDRKRAGRVFAHYGLEGPDEKAESESLAGLGDQWREAPLALLRAYLALIRERNENGPATIAQGMQASALYGTAKALDWILGASAVLAKTGTGPCTHHPRATADGFTVAIYPLAQPRLILLVREHGVTGAVSAVTAAAMLRSLESGTP
jgi:hypothetical protein